ncbi:hypothetical protein BDV96DRAFT_653680 [Lophiotrema nucula]|uniref:Uncharacterized protein n=1 Tax=Lophiotrema nucula TaxID=690887 RepID=A0A6A5YKA7_9PLEO|nr:hypothetical protein BDV96DRAFT_653680 [Lophiotrema nucula]
MFDITTFNAVFERLAKDDVDLKKYWRLLLSVYIPDTSVSYIAEADFRMGGDSERWTRPFVIENNERSHLALECLGDSPLSPSQPCTRNLARPCDTLLSHGTITFLYEKRPRCIPVTFLYERRPRCIPVLPHIQAQLNEQVRDLTIATGPRTALQNIALSTCLLRTCRQIHHEAASALYKQNTFMFKATKGLSIWAQRSFVEVVVQWTISLGPAPELLSRVAVDLRGEGSHYRRPVPRLPEGG